MKIAVFGATGFVGKQLVKEALHRGFEVRVLVRTPEKLGELASSVEVVTGDYFDPVALQETMKGTEAVLSTIGPPVRSKTLTPKDFGKAMEQLLSVMKEVGLRRVITLASAGTSYEGETIVFKRKLMRKVISLVAPLVIPSKEEELAVLRSSALDWTCIRPPLISSDVKGSLKVNGNHTVGAKVDVDQLVGLMLDNIESTRWIRAMPFVGTQA